MDNVSESDIRELRRSFSEYRRAMKEHVEEAREIRAKGRQDSSPGKFRLAVLQGLIEKAATLAIHAFAQARPVLEAIPMPPGRLLELQLLCECSAAIAVAGWSDPKWAIECGCESGSWRGSWKDAIDELGKADRELGEAAAKVRHRTPGSVAHATKVARRPKRTQKDRWTDEAHIADDLTKHPEATRDEVAKRTKIAPAHVSASKAWRQYKAKKQERQKKNRARGRGEVGLDEA